MNPHLAASLFALLIVAVFVGGICLLAHMVSDRIDQATRLPQHPRPVEPPTEPINERHP